MAILHSFAVTGPTSKPILVVQDTTDFVYRWAKPETIGAITHRVEVTAWDGSVSETEVELRYTRIHVLPPVGKPKRHPALDLTILTPARRSSR